jgi:hypothetical protein
MGGSAKTFFQISWEGVEFQCGLWTVCALIPPTAAAAAVVVVVEVLFVEVVAVVVVV